MAVCSHCNKEMLTAKSCLPCPIISGGKKVEQIRFGDDGWSEHLERCPNCGVKPGGYHHLGCDLESCSVCHTQLISCGCDEGWEDIYHKRIERAKDGLRDLLLLDLTKDVRPFLSHVLSVLKGNWDVLQDKQYEEHKRDALVEVLKQHKEL